MITKNRYRYNENGLYPKNLLFDKVRGKYLSLGEIVNKLNDNEERIKDLEYRIDAKIKDEHRRNERLAISEYGHALREILRVLEEKYLSNHMYGFCIKCDRCFPNNQLEIVNGKAWLCPECKLQYGDSI